MTFTTLGQVPTATTIAATNITTVAAQLNGSVNANYLSSVVTFEWGTTTSYGTTVTAIQSPITGNTSMTISASISGLSIGTTYHYRVKAVNSLGTTYGSDMTFTTLGQVPTATTITATNKTLTSATLNGTVNPNYLTTNVTFEYGLTASYGSTVTAIQSPLTGSANTNVSVNISNLSVGTTYHYHVKAVNSLGTTYGNNLTFTTLGQVPSATSQTASNVQMYSATLNGTVNPNYLTTNVTFEYGLTASYGSTVTAIQSSLTGSVNTNVSVNISNLTDSTTYHFRIKAENLLGITFSNDMIITTLNRPVDFDGNIYNSIRIGTQIWMAENLKTTKYNNGIEIPNVTDDAEWDALTIPAYCWYNNDASTYKSTYGALYNWYAVKTGSLCPTGWHVPSDAEWMVLQTYLGGQAIAGGKMKEPGTIHWISPNTGATNESGFLGLPGGTRINTGRFCCIGQQGVFWSSTELNLNFARQYTLVFDGTNFTSGGPTKIYGNSIRCLRDY